MARRCGNYSGHRFKTYVTNERTRECVRCGKPWDVRGWVTATCYSCNEPMRQPTEEGLCEACLPRLAPTEETLQLPVSVLKIIMESTWHVAGSRAPESQD